MGAEIAQELESLRKQREFELGEFTRALEESKAMCQQVRDQLASKEQEVKRKDKEMMLLRGKVLDSREEYFSNLQRLDATLTPTTLRKQLGT